MSKKETAMTKPEGGELLMLNTKGGTFRATPAKLDELVARGHVFEKVWKPEQDGDGIEGTFLGEGPPLEFTNALGERGKLRTFRVMTDPGMVRRVIGDYQVEHECENAIKEGLIGSACTMVYLGQVNTKRNMRANDWAISFVGKVGPEAA